MEIELGGLEQEQERRCDALKLTEIPMQKGENRYPLEDVTNLGNISRPARKGKWGGKLKRGAKESGRAKRNRFHSWLLQDG